MHGWKHFVDDAEALIQRYIDELGENIKDILLGLAGNPEREDCLYDDLFVGVREEEYETLAAQDARNPRGRVYTTKAFLVAEEPGPWMLRRYIMLLPDGLHTLEAGYFLPPGSEDFKDANIYPDWSTRQEDPALYAVYGLDALHTLQNAAQC